MNYAIATLIGFLAGLHTCTWGMYKDAQHEGFSWPKYFRSAIVGAILGAGTHYFTQWPLADEPAARFVYWGLLYCLERAATEFWKYFIREEDQSKYFIPMQFGIMGVPMKDPRKRIPIGLAVAAVCVALFFGLRALERKFPDLPTWLLVVTVGSVFGWISAFGGAWKDAPVEGFETFKFFRSPGVAAAWAAICALFVREWTVLAIAAEGFTVAGIETYKTFVFPNKPRGKFAGKPITHPEYTTWRYKFIPLYFGIWALVLGHLAWALARGHIPYVW
ncbi:MAG: hypothetical protein R3B06_06845 [Kofleriaceae bacterium]